MALGRKWILSIVRYPHQKLKSFQLQYGDLICECLIDNFTLLAYSIVISSACWCMAHYQCVANEMITDIFFAHIQRLFTCQSLANGKNVECPTLEC